MLKMIKHKNTQPEHIKLTTIFGYALFAVTVLSYLLTYAIPMSSALQYPGVRHFNVIAMVVVIGISAILPALVSYLIGDRATHTKNKALHHYNGVLFGIAAYWAAALFSWVSFSAMLSVGHSPYPTGMVVNFVIPVILAVLIMIAVAISYAKKQKSNASVLQYRPFQIVLIASVVIGFIFPYISNYINDTILGVIGTLSIPLVATAVAYIVLAKYQTTRLARLSDAIIAMSMGWVTVWLASSLIAAAIFEPSEHSFQIAEIMAYAAGLVVFAAYLFLRIRKL